MNDFDKRMKKSSRLGSEYMGTPLVFFLKTSWGKIPRSCLRKCQENITAKFRQGDYIEDAKL